MQNIRSICKVQRICSSTYCCRRGRPEVLPQTIRAFSSKYETPASELAHLYQEPYNTTHTDLFGDGRSKKPDSELMFNDFKSLHPSVLQSLDRLGFDKPLPVQLNSLKATLVGRDVVIKSITGSGKTLAFLLPLLCKVGSQIKSEAGRHPQAIVVAPTREICRQITQVIEEFVGPDRLINMVGGGDRVRDQARRARKEGKDIIVATPGRIQQLIAMNIIRPEQLKFLVLDEADELLHDVFYRQMRWILDHSNPSKQMVVTTATIPANVQFVIDRYMKHHKFIDLGGSAFALPEHIKHKAVLYEVKAFKRALKWVLANEHKTCSMVFVRAKEDCSKVAEIIRDWGYSAKYINSDLPESSRRSVMEEFREGRFSVLVATDVAARGVDVPECELVVQIKPYLGHTQYVHRSGRTGRAGRQGTSVIMLINNKRAHMEFLSDLAGVVQFEFYLYTNDQQYKLEPHGERKTQQ